MCSRSVVLYHRPAPHGHSPPYEVLRVLRSVSLGGWPAGVAGAGHKRAVRAACCAAGRQRRLRSVWRGLPHVGVPGRLRHGQRHLGLQVERPGDHRNALTCHCHPVYGLELILYVIAACAPAADRAGLGISGCLVPCGQKSSACVVWSLGSRTRRYAVVVMRGSGGSNAMLLRAAESHGPTVRQGACAEQGQGALLQGLVHPGRIHRVPAQQFQRPRLRPQHWRPRRFGLPQVPGSAYTAVRALLSPQTWPTYPF